jgi:hypothetical protein
MKDVGPGRHPTREITCFHGKTHDKSFRFLMSITPR